jgi:hypothetical protein
MKNRSGTFLLCVCLLAATACVAADGDRTLQSAGERVSTLALSRDAKGLAAFVGQNGVTCGDSVIGRDEVLHDLANSSSWLHSYFFDANHSTRHAKTLPPIGLREYLQRAEHVELVASQTADTYGCVRYKSSNFKLWPELCFTKEGDRWVFTDSPYACP